MELIKYAVCADNKDPHGLHRIRVIFLEEINVSSTPFSAPEILKKIDKNKNSSYIPWEYSTTNLNKDPYVIDAFLPKHINLIPNENELVKIIFFSNGVNSEIQYIGPEVNSSLDLKHQLYKNALSGSNKSLLKPVKKNLVYDGIQPAEGDVAFSGRNDGQLVYGKNSIVLRNGFIDRSNNTKNKNYPFIQMNAGNTTLDVIETDLTETVNPIIVLDNLVYVNIFKNTNSYETLISIIDCNSININDKVGLNNEIYNPLFDYLTITTPYITFKYIDKNFENVKIFIKNIKSGLDKKLLSNHMPEPDSLTFTVNTGEYIYTVFDNRYSINGLAINDRREIESGTYLWTTTPEQVDIIGVEDLISELKKGEYRNLKQNHLSETKITKIKKNIYNKKKDTSLLMSAKKLILGPYNGDIKVKEYGLTENEIFDLINTSQPTVKGDIMVQLLITLIDLVISHGHSTGDTVKGSLDEDSRKRLEEIKNLLTAKTNKDYSGGPDILNQHVRTI